MRSKPKAQNTDGGRVPTSDERVGKEQPDCDPKPDQPPDDADDSSDLDDSDLQNTDDDLWDVFILDDDTDPLPDYGDFWFPD
jgi:hypothetical protein